MHAGLLSVGGIFFVDPQLSASKPVKERERFLFLFNA